MYLPCVKDKSKVIKLGKSSLEFSLITTNIFVVDFTLLSSWKANIDNLIDVRPGPYISKQPNLSSRFSGFSNIYWDLSFHDFFAKG